MDAPQREARWGARASSAQGAHYGDQIPPGGRRGRGRDTGWHRGELPGGVGWRL